MFLNKEIKIPLIFFPLSLFVFSCAIIGSFLTILMSLLVVIFFIMGIDLFKNRLDDAVMRISAAMFALIYTSLFLSTVYHIHNLPKGRFLIVLLVVLIWITDTFAYFTGILIGKHRRIFKASPNKSLEGFIAGFIFALVFAYFATLIVNINLKIAFAAAVSAGIFGQLGDLFESVLKRDFQVKDSSNILPGHGGILDRFDSILIAAPVYYLILKLVIFR